MQALPTHPKDRLSHNSMPPNTQPGLYNEIGKSCMTVAVKACAKKKDANSIMK
jgi:hypothetical protein